MHKREQTLNEEIANAISHGAGVLFCLVAAPILIWYTLKNSEVSMVWGVSIFGFGMLMVYLSSTLYHAIQNREAKRILRIWDHISIYLLIAGSYTPLIIRYIETETATTFLTVMWGIVAVGSFLKVFYTGRFKVLSVSLYLGLGWMAIFIIKPLVQNLPWEVIWWLLAGGLSYSVGVIFYMREKKRYNHTIWHMFVLAGTITHYVAIFKSTLGPVSAG